MTKPLKRSWLKRKPPKHRTTKKPKRLRKVSPKRRKLMAEVGPVREAYRADNKDCEYPGCKKLGVDLHEITRGQYREAALGVEACLLHLCREHHDLMQPWPLEKQLAVKQLAGSGYDLEAVRRVIRGKSGREAVIVTEEDVEPYLEEIRDGMRHSLLR